MDKIRDGESQKRKEQVRDKVENRETLCFSNGLKVGPLKRRVQRHRPYLYCSKISARSDLVRHGSKHVSNKKCQNTPFWREAHFETKR